MIKEILHLFNPQIIIFSLIYFSVFVAIFLDLWSGVRKAKKRKEFRTSQGFRRTIDKLCRYFNMLFAISIVDCLQMLAIWQYNSQVSGEIPIVPILTFLGGIYAVYIEIRSIYESNEIKQKKEFKEANQDLKEFALQLSELIKKLKELKEN